MYIGLKKLKGVSEMKKYIVIISTVILMLGSSATIAGSITDSYTKGDVLTAAKLENIKSAVNDNNSASRFYGDGSAGPLTISANTNWSVTLPPGNNLNFTDMVIDSGQELIVPAGTTIRCAGTFTNNGSIVVEPNLNYGFYSLNLGNILLNSYVTSPGKGDAPTSAVSPEGHSALGVFLSSGSGGRKIPKVIAASSFNRFTTGGGGGTGSVSSVRGSGGGGLLKIYCKGGITNNGTVYVNDETFDVLSGSSFASGGGGGGGIVIFASATSVNNDSGVIQANGGIGSIATASSAASGGGGGGIVLLVAPSISNLGTVSVKGGVAGASGSTTITSGFHSGGGAGGASGGSGGSGGSVSASNVSSVAGNGQDGYVLQIQANPTSMMQ